jgi:hypothetical protein
LTSRICSVVEQDVSRGCGEATLTATHRAREIATFSRLREAKVRINPPPLRKLIVREKPHTGVGLHGRVIR